LESLKKPRDASGYELVSSQPPPGAAPPRKDLADGLLKDISGGIEKIKASDARGESAQNQIKELVGDSPMLSLLLGDRVDAFAKALLSPENIDLKPEAVLRGMMREILRENAGGGQANGPGAASPTDGPGQPTPGFAEELIRALRGDRVNTDNFTVVIGGRSKSLSDAIRAGDPLTSDLLRRSGLDQWSARNIVACIEEQSTAPLAYESLAR
jgi:hypothetical protein